MPLLDRSKTSRHVDALSVLDDIRRTGELIEEFRRLKKHGGSRASLERLRREINKLKEAQTEFLNNNEREQTDALAPCRSDGLMMTPRLRSESRQKEEIPTERKFSPQRLFFSGKRSIATQIATEGEQKDAPRMDEHSQSSHPPATMPTQNRDDDLMCRKYCSVTFAVVLAEAHTRREIVHKYEKKRIKIMASFRERRIMIALKYPVSNEQQVIYQSSLPHGHIPQHDAFLASAKYTENPISYFGVPSINANAASIDNIPMLSKTKYNENNNNIVTLPIIVATKEEKNKFLREHYASIYDRKELEQQSSHTYQIQEIKKESEGTAKASTQQLLQEGNRIEKSTLTYVELEVQHPVTHKSMHQSTKNVGHAEFLGRADEAQRIAEEEERRRVKEAQRIAEEEERRRVKEAQRIAEEEEQRRVKEAQRIAEEEEQRRVKEAQRIAEEEEQRRVKEAQRIAEEEERRRVKEAQRIAEEEEQRRVKEAQRIAEEEERRRVKEAQRIAEEEERRRVKEAQRIAEEEEQRRVKEAQRIAEEEEQRRVKEAQRIAEEEERRRVKEAQRIAEEEEQRRVKEAQRIAEEEEQRRVKEVQRIAEEEERRRVKEAQRIAEEEEQRRVKEAQRIAEEEEQRRVKEVQRIAEEEERRRVKEAQRIAEEEEQRRVKEVQRIAEEEERRRVKEAQRIAEEEEQRRVKEAQRIAEEEEQRRVKEAQRIAEEEEQRRVKEAQRIAEEEEQRRVKEARRIAEEEEQRRVKEAQRIAEEEEQRRVKEAQRIAEEEEQRRVKEVQRIAEEEERRRVKEAQRIAEEEEQRRVKEAQRIAEEEEQRRVKEAQRIAEEEEQRRVKEVQRIAEEEEQRRVKEVQRIAEEEEQRRVKEAQRIAEEEEQRRVKEAQRIAEEEEQRRVKEVQRIAEEEEQRRVKEVQRIAEEEERRRVEDSELHRKADVADTAGEMLSRKQCLTKIIFDTTDAFISECLEMAVDEFKCSRNVVSASSEGNFGGFSESKMAGRLDDKQMNNAENEEGIQIKENEVSERKTGEDEEDVPKLKREDESTIHITEDERPYCSVEKEEQAVVRNEVLTMSAVVAGDAYANKIAFLEAMEVLAEDFLFENLNTAVDMAQAAINAVRLAEEEEQRRVKEAQRIAEEEEQRRVKEAQRIAEEEERRRVKEAQRIAEEEEQRRVKEAQRIAEEEEQRRVKEAQRIAEEEEQRRVKEAQRIAEEEEQRRVKEAQRIAEEEEQRRVKEAQRIAEEEEQRRVKEAQRIAEEEERRRVEDSELHRKADEADTAGEMLSRKQCLTKIIFDTTDAFISECLEMAVDEFKCGGNVVSASSEGNFGGFSESKMAGRLDDKQMSNAENEEGIQIKENEVSERKTGVDEEDVPKLKREDESTIHITEDERPYCSVEKEEQAVVRNEVLTMSAVVAGDAYANKIAFLEAMEVLAEDFLFENLNTAVDMAQAAINAVRLAEEEEQRRVKEAQRIAEEEEQRRVKEAQRIAEEEEQRRVKEAQRIAEEEEQRRVKEAQRIAEEEEQRRVKEAQRIAEEEEQRRVKEAQRIAEEEERRRVEDSELHRKADEADTAGEMLSRKQCLTKIIFDTTDAFISECLEMAVDELQCGGNVVSASSEGSFCGFSESKMAGRLDDKQMSNSENEQGIQIKENEVSERKTGEDEEDVPKLKREDESTIHITEDERPYYSVEREEVENVRGEDLKAEHLEMSDGLTRESREEVKAIDPEGLKDVEEPSLDGLLTRQRLFLFDHCKSLVDEWIENASASYNASSTPTCSLAVSPKASNLSRNTSDNEGPMKAPLCDLTDTPATGRLESNLSPRVRRASARSLALEEAVTLCIVERAGAAVEAAGAVESLSYASVEAALWRVMQDAVERTVEADEVKQEEYMAGLRALAERIASDFMFFASRRKLIKMDECLWHTEAFLSSEGIASCATSVVTPRIFFEGLLHSDVKFLAQHYLDLARKGIAKEDIYTEARLRENLFERGENVSRQELPMRLCPQSSACRDVLTVDRRRSGLTQLVLGHCLDNLLEEMVADTAMWVASLAEGN